MSQIYPKFECFLFTQKGLQPITVANHLSAIRRIHYRIGTLTNESANDYVLNLYKSDYSYSHKANQVRAIEYWFEHLGQRVIFARQQKPRPIIKQTLTEAEVTRLIFVCRNLREKAIVSLLAYSGLRPKELRSLRLQDINFGTNEIRVIQGKGLKDGIIYISSVCTRILLEYLTNHPRQPEDLMFVTYDGLRPFGQGCLRKLIKVLTCRAGLAKRVYPYLLRHSLATAMFNRGADILTVKHQLRHSQIETTEHYIHSLGYCPRNKYDLFVPSYI